MAARSRLPKLIPFMMLHAKVIPLSLRHQRQQAEAAGPAALQFALEPAPLEPRKRCTAVWISRLRAGREARRAGAPPSSCEPLILSLAASTGSPHPCTPPRPAGSQDTAGGHVCRWRAKRLLQHALARRLPRSSWDLGVQCSSRSGCPATSSAVTARHEVHETETGNRQRRQPKSHMINCSRWPLQSHLHLTHRADARPWATAYSPALPEAQS